jgi:hypothetical protein
MRYFHKLFGLIALGMALQTAPAAAQNDPNTPPDNVCIGKANPEEAGAHYCKAYRSTPLLENDKEIQNAEDACAAFYAKAAESINALCDYRGKASFFRHRMLELQSKIGSGENPDTPEIREAANRAAEVAQQSAEIADKLETELTQARKALDSALDAVKNRGVHRMRAEITCTLNGDEERSPGAFLEGLYLWQSKDTKATFDNVDQALNDMRNMALASANSRRGQLGHPERISVQSPSEGSTLPPDCAASKNVRDLQDSSVPGAATITAIGGVLTTNPRFASISPVLRGAYAVKVTYDLLVHHIVPVHTLVIAGIAGAASFYVGPEAYVPVSTTLTAADTELQNVMNARKRRYLDFVAKKMDENISISSEDLGRAWKGLPENQGSCYPDLPGYN